MLFIIMTVLLFNMYFMEIRMVNLRRKCWIIDNNKNSHLHIVVKLFLYQTISSIFTEQSWNFISLGILQHSIIIFIYNHTSSGNSKIMTIFSVQVELNHSSSIRFKKRILFKYLDVYKPNISLVFFNLAPRSKRLSGPRGLKRNRNIST